MASTSSTPYRPSYRSKSAYLGPSSSTSSLTQSSFTPTMRDRQARGKDPYRSGDNSDEGTGGSGSSDERSGGPERSRMRLSRMEKEDFTRLERRHKAVAFLDNPELLMMYAQSKGDSIPGARLHFTRMLCGYEKPPSSPSSSSKKYTTSTGTAASNTRKSLGASRRDYPSGGGESSSSSSRKDPATTDKRWTSNTASNDDDDASGWDRAA